MSIGTVQLSEHEIWEIGYFVDSSLGLAEIACEKDYDKSNHRLLELRTDCIRKARDYRKQLLEKYDLVIFGSLLLNRKDNSIFSLGMPSWASEFNE